LLKTITLLKQGFPVNDGFIHKNCGVAAIIEEKQFIFTKNQQRLRLYKTITCSIKSSKNKVEK
jgi:hypothetical protein